MKTSDQVAMRFVYSLSIWRKFQGLDRLLEVEVVQDGASLEVDE